MGPISFPKRRQETTVLRCVKFQNIAEFVYTAAEGWNHAWRSLFFFWGGGGYGGFVGFEKKAPTFRSLFSRRKAAEACWPPTPTYRRGARKCRSIHVLLLQLWAFVGWILPFYQNFEGICCPHIRVGNGYGRWKQNVDAHIMNNV